MSDPNVDPVKGLLTYLATNLVDEQGEVEVNAIEDETTVTYEIRVAPNDRGKVIGKQGRIANALRNVAKASSGPDKRRVFVDLVD